MKKRLPKLKSNKAAEKLLDQDLSEYLTPENFSLTSFEYAPKNKTITIRISNLLLAAVRNASKRKRISYQRYIRESLEDSLKKKAA